MTLINRIAARLGFVRQSFADDLLWMLSGGMPTKAGIPLSHMQAMQVSVVLACVRVIAEGIGALPASLRQRTPEGSEPIPGNQAGFLLEEPNGWMTWQEFSETLTMHAALTCNGYALIQRGIRGQPLALLPLLPAWVQSSQLDDWSIEYRVTLPGGQSRLVGIEDMFHLRGPSWDGVVGLEIVKLARESIGLSAAIE